ncbi:SUMO-activating enzyme subunit 1 [Anthonomus grandis grandis]|uniref:SUMO-activating enzyme subunit 1 n=1 Tax=Anthonomus grandis grandis TaxID=2921223 RepID=UPI002165AC02|nr:SUMO-activating enzyme subunit 1 [Anthonomus grandis grandis]
MSEQKLSAVEAELYDRQIRLWGIESQERLRASNVLLIGVRGVGSEIAKNILLSGINSLVILDDGTVTEEEQNKNFLINKNSIGKKIAEEVLLKAQALNPLVTITADISDPTKKDAKFFEGFTIIIATRIKTDFLMKLDKICRASNVKLIFGDVFGSFGYSVTDFHEHDYHEDQIKLPTQKRAHDGTMIKGEKEIVKTKGQIIYPELKRVIILPNTKQSIDHIKKTKRRNEYFYLMLILLEFRNRQGRNPEYLKKEKDIELLKEIKSEVLDLYEVDHSKLKDELFEIVFGEVVPVCAIVGGVIAQEVIKGVSQKEVPINNVFLFDPITFSGKEETIG